jgi:hypothetical protein
MGYRCIILKLCGGEHLAIGDPMKKNKLVIANRFPPLSPAEKQLKELINGRKPINEEEGKIVKQLEGMKAKGQIPYILSDLL